MARTTTKKVSTNEETAEETVVIETPKKTIKKEVKKFAKDEGIPCRSITTGGLYMPSKKTVDLLYRWENEGDITEVEYQDLMAEIRSNSSYITAPRFIIEDEEFINQNPRLEKIYESMYDVGDFTDLLLNSPASALVPTIDKLPNGARESIKHLASELVTNGFLDSIAKIKALDDYFGTDLKLLAGF